MKSTPRSRLWLEQLENRLVPSLTVSSFSGTLFVSGLPTGNLVLNETAASAFQVMDGTHNLGTYAHISNVNLNLTNHQGNFIEFNLMGNTLTGNLFINVGQGSSVNNAANHVAVYSGRVGGSVTLVGGVGFEALILGFTNGDTTLRGLSVGGDVTFTPKANNVSPIVNDILDTGALLSATAGGTVVIGGNVNTTNASVVGLGARTTVGKNVSIQAGQEFRLRDIDIAATIDGSASVTGGSGPVTDSIDLGGPFSNGAPTILGNLTINLPGGTPFLDLGDSFGATVGGNVSITGGTQGGTYTLGGGATPLLVNGSLTVNLGDANNTLSVATKAQVGADTQVSAGAGNDSIALDGAMFGNLRVSLGNGNDTVTIGNAPGSQLLWSSGNGNDSVTFGDASNAAGETWNVNMRFGTGNDTLTLAGNGTVASPEGLTGFIDMGGPPGGNSFDPTGSLAAGTWVIVQPFTLQNV
jgi:hypothetical protein